MQVVTQSTTRRAREAALAEAWHHDGLFDEAAEFWQSLAKAEFDLPDSAIKAAISFYAANDERQGTRWLGIADRHRALSQQIIYIEAQRFWAIGDIDRAIEHFEQGQLRYPAHVDFAVALAILFQRTGRVQCARQQIAKALLHSPENAYALLNRVILDIGRVPFDEAAASLRDIVRRLPHRVEPHLLYARMCQRHGKSFDASQARQKAALRKAYLAAIPRDSSEAGRIADADVARLTGRVAANVFELQATLTCRRPEWLNRVVLLNRGFEYVSVGQPRLHLAPACGTGVSNMRLSADLDQYLITEEMWQPIPEGFALALHMRGLPCGAGVRISTTEIELAEGAGWLPLSLPALPTRWQIEPELPSGFVAMMSVSEPQERGVGFLAVHRPESVSTILAGTEVTAIGRADRTDLTFASYMLQRGLKLWRDVIGPARIPCPPLIVVDRDHSTFCYTRKNYIRVPSGILRTGKATAILLHEAGHVWWGAGVRFNARSEWLAEALAEYTLHLAETAGLMPGYARSTISTLQRVGNGRVPAASLSHLAGLTDGKSAYLLRAKGGFVIAALRRTIGEAAFRRVLEISLDSEEQHELDAYEFFAAASLLHGSSLNWFVNQWCYVDGAMHLRTRLESVEAKPGCYRTSFEAFADGAVVPGTDVDFAIETTGTTETIKINLDLGSCSVIVTTAHPPSAIVPDPCFRLLASRDVLEIAP